jgi:hypothetical protein
VAMGAAALAGAVPAAGGGVIAAAGRAFAALTWRDPLDLATVTAATFRPHVGTRFTLSPEARRAFEVTLDGVDSRPSEDGSTDTFTLRFRADRPVDLDQAIHRLDHDALGRFGMFLVPRGPRTVEAVVNHLLA